ncbi:MAG TPA: dihydropteroate synthase [Caulobacteraceae bacterium]|jgi:dihydropteroate synthase
MGVVNVTPDSFSDGGRFFDEAAAVARGHKLAADGANILDVGGESTRPGAEPVSEADEIARVVPVIEKLRAGCNAAISIDTMKPKVARAAMAAGASIWNDVTSLGGSPDSAKVAADLGCGVILMHMQGEPRTMQTDPRYDDVVCEVGDELVMRAEVAMAAGVARENIWLDPGIGFGKTLTHNLALLKHLGALTARGFPVVLGVSRKSFLKTIDPTAESADDRLGGSLSAALWGAANGAHVLRVHDVRETRQALETWRRIEGA